MRIISLFTYFLLSVFILTNCAPKEEPVQTETEESVTAVDKTSHEDLVKRGAYLVEIMSCHDCHTPKVMTDQGPAPDPNRLLSGHPADEKLASITDKSVLQNYALFNMSLTAAIGPWGTSFAANLTPDETGLGNWTIGQFGKAIREGQSKGMDGTRMLLPPMPWQNLRNISDDDLAAIWAYLQSIPPIENVVPTPIPPAG